MRKGGDVAAGSRGLLAAILTCGIYGSALGQALPEDAIQANFSGYFDNYDASVVYPNLAVKFS